MKKVGILTIWLAVVALGAVGVWWFSRDAFLEDAVVVRRLAPIEGAGEMRAEVLRALVDSRGSAANTATPGAADILWWGQFPADEEALTVLNQLWESRDEAGLRWDEIWLDEGFHDLLPGRAVYLRGANAALTEELRALRAEGRHVIIVTAPLFAASFLKGSPAAEFAKSEMPFRSVLWLEAPRSREDESKLNPPCVLPHADLKGSGALGCRLLQSARSTYRHQFPTGARLFQLESLSSGDLLAWRTRQ